MEVDMPGLYINSPNLIGKPYKDVADYPNTWPIAQSPDGRKVYKGFRKVFLVVNDTVVDFYDWEPFGDQYRHIQKQAQRAWGMTWPI
jgi:hypothetical protein